MIEKVRTRSFLLMIAHGLVIGGNAAAHFFLAHILDPEVYGSIFVFLTILSFVLMFSMLGFQHVMMHQAPRLEEKKDYKNVDDSAFMGIFTCVIAFFVKPWRDVFWGYSRPRFPSVRVGDDAFACLSRLG